MIKKLIQILIHTYIYKHKLIVEEYPQDHRQEKIICNCGKSWLVKKADKDCVPCSKEK